jgi:putative DNA methylase
MTPTYPKKLIEVALPLPEINDASSYDKMPGIGPHPKGIHHWWARLPLPCARAVLFASVVTDPSDDPAWKDKSEAEQDAERERLFGILRRLMGKKLHEHPDVYEEANKEMLRHCDGKLPPVLDPFSGGGSIPLEAARLGFEAHAADLNPVAVLLNKCNLELAPRWAGHAPVNPEDSESDVGTQVWTGTKGLAADVRYYGRLIRERALEKIGHLYPKVKLPEELGGVEANVTAWLWTRTVASPNPAARGKQVPLVSSFMLATKVGRQAWAELIKDDSIPHGWRFDVKNGSLTKEQVLKAKLGTRAGKAQDFLCFITGTPIPRSYIQEEGKARRLGQALMAVVADGERKRIYVSPTHIQEDVATKGPDKDAVEDSRATFLAGSLPNRAGITGGVCSAYGLDTWGELFSSRQIFALLTASDLLRALPSEIMRDAELAGLGGDGAEAYASSVTTFLALNLDRCADLNNALCTWNSSDEVLRNLFKRQALPMVWDFAEANFLADVVGGWTTCIDRTAKCILTLSSGEIGHAIQADAANAASGVSGLLVSTDPPYYDNIGYAALSDFFYVWLRRSIGSLHPELFTTMLAPKDPELTATPARFDGDREKAKQHFEAGFRSAFTGLIPRLSAEFPLTVYYAFKQSDDEDSNGSDDGEEFGAVDLTTGWETLLEALISSGFTITATWPIRASQSWRMVAQGANTLASYILLACRLRRSDAPRVGRNAFVAELKRELPPALHHLQQGNVAPVDFAQAAIGPGMAVFSRYAAVLESSGKPMSVRTVLGIINGMKDELLGESIEELDKNTRWAVQWFGEDGFEWGDSGKANLLANAQATSLSGLVADGILEVKGSKVRLISPEALQGDWDPETDKRVTVWEMTHHLLRVYYHERRGDASTAALLRKLGTKADVARDLAYKLFTVCENRKWSREAQAYNALVMGWPELVRLARETPTESTSPVATTGELF